jgi:phosphate transport system substrate-binding protein
MKHLLKTSLFIATFLILGACNEPTNSSGKKLDTPTTGHIQIMVDEGYRSIVASAIDVFDTIYRQASIEAIYTSEGDALNNLFKDSVQVVVISRDLTQEEIDKFYTPRGFKPAMTPIAYDAVAFILNPENTDSVVTKEQLKKIMTGEFKSWKEINPSSKLGAITVVFDNPLSGTVRYVRDSIAHTEKLPDFASALETNEEVIDYVAKNKNAIGIINANVISDTDDKGAQSFLKQIRLWNIAEKPGDEAFGPYQAYLATNQYPYKRTVYVINAQPRKGLGLGFASFMAGPAGQTIVHKDGLLSANAVTRLIEIQR